ncbi:MAG TPA: ABC transporter substrate-binding protein [Bacilli bacterium]|nr:ABC transporter substrate-binding protein [Bacilli bacterium]
MNFFTTKKMTAIVTATVLSTTLLAGCGDNTATDQNNETNNQQQAEQGTEKKITHVWGDTTLQETPTKIAALDFSFVDELTALGVSPVATAGAGKTEVPEYLADQVKDYTYVGERKEPNLEVLTSAAPDLIIANPDRHSMIKNELSGIAPTIALDDRSYEEVLKNTDLLAEVLGKQEQATAVKKELETKINDAKSKITTKPTVLVVGAFEDEFTVWVKDSFIGSLLTAINTDYVYNGDAQSTEGKAEVAKMTVEKLAETNPDYLFVYGDLSLWKDNPLFKNLKATQDNHVLEVDRNLWSRGRGPIAAKLIIEEAVPFMSGESK